MLKGAAGKGAGDEKSEVEIKREKISTKDKAANQDRPACICCYPFKSSASSSSFSCHWTCRGKQVPRGIKISKIALLPQDRRLDS